MDQRFPSLVALTKFLSSDEVQAIIDRLQGQSGELLLFVANSPKVCNDILFRRCVKLGERLKLVEPNEMALCWVVAFPKTQSVTDLLMVRLPQLMKNSCESCICACKWRKIHVSPGLCGYI